VGIQEQTIIPGIPEQPVPDQQAPFPIENVPDGASDVNQAPPEEIVYAVAHATGEVRSGTLGNAREMCPALASLPLAAARMALELSAMGTKVMTEKGPNPAKPVVSQAEKPRPVITKTPDRHPHADKPITPTATEATATVHPHAVTTELTPDILAEEVPHISTPHSEGDVVPDLHQEAPLEVTATKSKPDLPLPHTPIAAITPYEAQLRPSLEAPAIEAPQPPAAPLMQAELAAVRPSPDETVVYTAQSSAQPANETAPTTDLPKPEAAPAIAQSFEPFPVEVFETAENALFTEAAEASALPPIFESAADAVAPMLPPEPEQQATAEVPTQPMSMPSPELSEAVELIPSVEHVERPTQPAAIVRSFAENVTNVVVSREQPMPPLMQEMAQEITVKMYDLPEVHLPAAAHLLTEITAVVAELQQLPDEMPPAAAELLTEKIEALCAELLDTLGITPTTSAVTTLSALLRLPHITALMTEGVPVVIPDTAGTHERKHGWLGQQLYSQDASAFIPHWMGSSALAACVPA
jgi:hypothetical protein